MKYRILSLVVAALIPVAVFAADNLQVTQGSGTTVAADEVSRNSISEKQQVIKLGLGAEGQHDGLLDAGQQDKSLSVPVVLPQNQSPVPLYAQRIASDAAETSSTSTIINATAHVAAVDDIIQFVGGTAANLGRQRVVSATATNTITVSPAFPTAPANGDTFLILRPATPLMGGVNNSSGLGAGPIVNLDWRYQDSTSNGALKREDDSHTSGDAGFQCLGITDDNTPSPTTTTTGRYAPGVYSSITGAQQISIIQAFQSSAGGGLLNLEDAAANSGDAGVVGLALNSGNNAFASSAGSANEYAVLIQDGDGRLAVNPFGANVTNWFFACGTATATTGDVAAKAAAGSGVRNYITSISCKNTSATVATTLDFKDGTNIAAVGGISQMATTSPGSFSYVPPVPIRGSANTAFNFATNISVTSVTCCVQGFTSSN